MGKWNTLALLRKNRAIGYKIKYLYYFFSKQDRLEKRISCGSLNPDKVIYIVKPDNVDGVEGLLSLVARASIYIRYGYKNGYKVCVDWKNYKTQYYDSKHNVWEYFFKQPSVISLDEAYKSKNVILSGWTFKDINPNAVFSSELFFDHKLATECYELLNSTIHLSYEIEKKCLEESNRLKISECLGVYIRGTDYTALKPSGEYIQPTVNQVISKIDDFMLSYNDPSIYIVTEDGKIYDEIKKKYGEKVVTVSFDSFIYDYKGKDFLSKSGVLNADKKSRGINYLVKMVLLSQCKYLISSITMGSMFSYGLNGGKYEDQYIFSLGLYP